MSSADAERAGIQRLVFFVHDDRAIAATLLRGVEGLVRELDQSFQLPSGLWLHAGRANTECDVSTFAKRRMTNGEGRKTRMQLLAEFFDMSATDVVQQNRELFTAIARR